MRQYIGRQSGDTLVEVVISLAILAVTIVTSFDIANRSYSEGFQAREQTQAIYLAQEQAERLYLYRNTLVNTAIANNDSNGVIETARNFGMCTGSCYFDPSNPTSASPPTAGVYSVPYLLDNITYSVSISPLQATGIVTGNAHDEGAFAIKVTWNSSVATDIVVNGNTNQNSTGLNLILIDPRGLIPRDCSVAGSALCS